MMKEHTMIFERLWKDYSKRLNGCGDDYTATCMLDYPYFKKHYKMIETDLGKKQMLINNKRLMLIQKQYKKLMLNLDRAENTKIFLILEAAKETILDFYKEL